jgi:hypothetical protein
MLIQHNRHVTEDPPGQTQYRSEVYGRAGKKQIGTTVLTHIFRDRCSKKRRALGHGLPPAHDRQSEDLNVVGRSAGEAVDGCSMGALVPRFKRQDS